MTGKLLFTFNAGSSTVKIGMFALEQAGARRIGKGMIDFRRAPLRFTLSEGPDTFDIALETGADAELQDILQEAFQRLSWHFVLGNVAAIGHRVVHGGDRFAGPVRLDDDAIAAIDDWEDSYREADRALRGAPLGTPAVGALRDLARDATARTA